MPPRPNRRLDLSGKMPRISDAQLELAVIRTAAYQEQKRIRTAAKGLVNKEWKNADPVKMVRSSFRKRKEIDAFVRWLDQSMTAGEPFAPPDDGQRIARWIIRNERRAFAAYNPYLLQLARETARSVRASRFFPDIANVVDKLTAATKKWLSRND